MAEIGHDRLYSVLLRRLGIKLAQGMKLDDTVQPVAIVDDFSDLTRPLVGATFGAQAPRAPVVALRGAAELSSQGAAGFILFWDDAASNFSRYTAGRLALITANITEFAARDIRMGDEEQSLVSRFRVRSGTIPGAAPAGVVTRSNTTHLIPIYMPPGTIVTIVNGAVNDDQNVGFIWTELPDL